MTTTVNMCTKKLDSQKFEQKIDPKNQQAAQESKPQNNLGINKVLPAQNHQSPLIVSTSSNNLQDQCSQVCEASSSPPQRFTLPSESSPSKQNLQLKLRQTTPSGATLDTKFPQQKLVGQQRRTSNLPEQELQHQLMQKRTLDLRPKSNQQISNSSSTKNSELAQSRLASQGRSKRVSESDGTNQATNLRVYSSGQSFLKIQKADYLSEEGASELISDQILDNESANEANFNFRNKSYHHRQRSQASRRKEEKNKSEDEEDEEDAELEDEDENEEDDEEEDEDQDQQEGGEYATQSAFSEEESMILEESFDCFGEIAKSLKKETLQQQEIYNQKNKSSHSKSKLIGKGNQNNKLNGSDILLQGQLNNSKILKNQPFNQSSSNSRQNTCQSQEKISQRKGSQSFSQQKKRSQNNNYQVENPQKSLAALYQREKLTNNFTPAGSEHPSEQEAVPIDQTQTQQATSQQQNKDDRNDTKQSSRQQQCQGSNSKTPRVQTNLGNASNVQGKLSSRLAKGEQIKSPTNQVKIDEARMTQYFKLGQDMKNNLNDSAIADENQEQQNSQIMKTSKQVKRPKLVVNVFYTKYDIVREVAKDYFQMRVCEDDIEEFDLFWSDTAMPPEKLQKLKPYQRLNHYPGMYVLARKNNLGKHLNKMAKKYEQEYSFYPKTWMLPSEMTDFKNQYTTSVDKNQKVVYIVKPEASCQGKGIFLTRNISEIELTEHSVVQRYVNKPYLMDGLKFDLRIYVLVYGVDPLHIFLYKDGLCRLATQPYQQVNNNNIEEMCMHLTNYAVNKFASNFVQNKDAKLDSVGHKRSLKFTMRYLKNVKGEDTETLWDNIKDIIVKTLIAGHPTLNHVYKSCQPDDLENSLCFEILGFDIMLDHRCKPILLEVNHSPSFSTDSPLDYKIKSELIRDTIKLLGMSAKRKNFYKQQMQEDMEKRMLTGKSQKPQGTFKDKLKADFMNVRDQYELKNLGGYELIYPSEYEESMKEYQKLLDHSKEIWEIQTGCFGRKKRLESLENKPKPFVVSTASKVLPVQRQFTKTNTNSTYQQSIYNQTKEHFFNNSDYDSIKVPSKDIQSQNTGLQDESMTSNSNSKARNNVKAESSELTPIQRQFSRTNGFQKFEQSRVNHRQGLVGSHSNSQHQRLNRNIKINPLAGGGMGANQSYDHILGKQGIDSDQLKTLESQMLLAKINHKALLNKTNGVSDYIDFQNQSELFKQFASYQQLQRLSQQIHVNSVSQTYFENTQLNPQQFLLVNSNQAHSHQLLLAAASLAQNQNNDQQTSNNQQQQQQRQIQQKGSCVMVKEFFPMMIKNFQKPFSLTNGFQKFQEQQLVINGQNNFGNSQHIQQLLLHAKEAMNSGIPLIEQRIMQDAKQGQNKSQSIILSKLPADNKPSPDKKLLNKRSQVLELKPLKTISINEVQNLGKDKPSSFAQNVVFKQSESKVGCDDFSTPLVTKHPNSNNNNSSRQGNTNSDLNVGSNQNFSLTPQEERKLKDQNSDINKSRQKEINLEATQNRGASRPPLGNSINKLVQNRENLLQKNWVKQQQQPLLDEDSSPLFFSKTLSGNQFKSYMNNNNQINTNHMQHMNLRNGNQVQAQTQQSLLKQQTHSSPVFQKKKFRMLKQNSLSGGNCSNQRNPQQQVPEFKQENLFMQQSNKNCQRQEYKSSGSLKVIQNTRNSLMNRNSNADIISQSQGLQCQGQSAYQPNGSLGVIQGQSLKPGSSQKDQAGNFVKPKVLDFQPNHGLRSMSYGQSLKEKFIQNQQEESTTNQGSKAQNTLTITNGNFNNSSNNNGGNVFIWSKGSTNHLQTYQQQQLLQQHPQIIFQHIPK